MVKRVCRTFFPAVLFLVTLLFLSSTYADYPDTLTNSYWIGSAQLGLMQMNGPVNSSYVFNNSINPNHPETDSLHQTNAPLDLTYSLGGGYGYRLHATDAASDTITWLPAIEALLNVYYFNIQPTGEVYQYQNSAQNNFNYNMRLSSTRLMLDGKLIVATWKDFSVYTLAGIGPGFNQVGYSDTASNAQTNGAMSLTTHSFTQLALEGGAGFEYQFTPHIGSLAPHLAVSLSYLYAYLGKWSTSTQGSKPNGGAGLPLASPAQFYLSTSSEFLGLEWRF